MLIDAVYRRSAEFNACTPYYVSAALQTSSKLHGQLVPDYGTNLHG